MTHYIMEIPSESTRGLSPCPLCRGVATRCPHPRISRAFCVECVICNLVLTARNQATADDKWNRRTK